MHLSKGTSSGIHGTCDVGLPGLWGALLNVFVDLHEILDVSVLDDCGSKFFR